MNNKITRRDFLKLAGLLPLSVAAPGLDAYFPPSKQTGKSKNIIIVVFDAFSANNMSLYGYRRETTPNLARLAERAVVYHNHYAGGNFTAPGTASLLTGTLPWKHRSFKFGKKPVADTYVEKNLFTAFQKYYRLAYSHNQVANRLIFQLSENLDDYIPSGRLFLTNNNLIEKLFWEDEDIATVSWVRTIKTKEEGFAYSLFLSHLYKLNREKEIRNILAQFPRGLPSVAGDNYFLLEDAVDWLSEKLDILPQPFIGYFHFMPPHRPYHTHQEFYSQFLNDNLIEKRKSLDLNFISQGFRYSSALKTHTNYDEFILYVDREFGRLIDYLDSSGALENTWVVLTSDHGEMFERGVIGHITPLLYEPVVRIPLMIFEPGRKKRMDVHMPTSAIDVLPTLLHVTGQPRAGWTEGIVLPPFSISSGAEERSVFIVEAKKNDKYSPLTIATVAMIRENYKLMYFFGYNELSGKERIELYDVENDPEELNNLYNVKGETASDMFHELKTKLAEVDEPFL